MTITSQLSGRSKFSLWFLFCTFLMALVIRNHSSFPRSRKKQTLISSLLILSLSLFIIFLTTLPSLTSWLHSPSPNFSWSTVLGSTTVNDMTSYCNIFDGKWMLDDSHDHPLYQPGSCPYIDDAFNCFNNGRLDNGYLRYRWKPNGCEIPRFSGKKMLEILAGKRLAFVGDSLNRNMWESLICALRESLTDKSRISGFSGSGSKGFGTDDEIMYSFRFEDYNCSIEYIRSPFLVQFNRTDQREAVRLDVIQGTSLKYNEADIIVFNTGHWWNRHKTYRGRNFFQEGETVYRKLRVGEAYIRALQTWAKWVDDHVDIARTQVLFAGFSSIHYKGGQWNSGGSCDGETKPITNDTQLAPYPKKMQVLESVISDMKTPVLFLNFTKMTAYRKDGHPSFYRQPQHRQTTPNMSQDCAHWCLPGVPDYWNQLLYATLLASSNHKGSTLEGNP